MLSFHYTFTFQNTQPHRAISKLQILHFDKTVTLTILMSNGSVLTSGQICLTSRYFSLQKTTLEIIYALSFSPYCNHHCLASPSFPLINEPTLAPHPTLPVDNHTSSDPIVPLRFKPAMAARHPLGSTNGTLRRPVIPCQTSTKTNRLPTPCIPSKVQLLQPPSLFPPAKLLPTRPLSPSSV